jgi:hypothetical protein
MTNAVLPWWRRRPTRGEVIVAVGLLLIVAAIIFAILLVGSMMGDRISALPPLGLLDV